MALLTYRFNVAFFVLWVVWCAYRGILCSQTSIPDVLAPVNYSDAYPTLGFHLLVFPFVAPIVSILVSAGCLHIKAGHKWWNAFIIVFSIVTMLFRALINVSLPFWF